MFKFCIFIKKRWILSKYYDPVRWSPVSDLFKSWIVYWVCLVWLNIGWMDGSCFGCLEQLGVTVCVCIQFKAVEWKWSAKKYGVLKYIGIEYKWIFYSMSFTNDVKKRDENDTRWEVNYESYTSRRTWLWTIILFFFLKCREKRALTTNQKRAEPKNTK